MGETVKNIAEMYSHNPRSLKYFMKKNGIKVREKFGTFSDEELENQIVSLFDKHPNVGM